MNTMRMMRFALAAALTVAAPLAAQSGGAEAPAQREQAQRRPFDALFRHRAELGLSDAQLRQIEAVRARLEERNAPLRQELAARTRQMRAERRTQLERMTPEERRRELQRLRRLPADQRVPADVRPVVRQMRVNIEEATHQAQGVLTPEQRVRARELLRAEMRAARPAPRRGEGARPRPRPRRQP
jgi:hypothetical protein